MDCNINRYNLDNNQPSSRNMNHSKSFQDNNNKGIKRYRNNRINVPLNDDNIDYRNIRNNSIKKNYNVYDDQSMMENEMMKSNHLRSDQKYDSYSYKCYNGDKPVKNITYNPERKPPLKSSLNEYQRNDLKKVNKSNDYKSDRKPNDAKETNSYRKDKNNIRIKFNFLQESQLDNDKLDCASDNSKGTSIVTNNSLSNFKTSTNGLNPAAVEFTPSSTSSLSPLDNNSKTIQQITDAIENGFKSLSFGIDNGNNNNNNTNTISNPIVIDNCEYNYTNPQLSMFPEHTYPGKLSLIDQSSSIYQNMYQCRPVPRLSFPQAPNNLPQFQLALYGTPNPQLIRYNPAQNFQGSYFFYNPLMFNHGMYNSSSPLLAATNRLLPLASPDISTQIAHPLNSNITMGNYPSSYYQDSSMNNGLSHIR